ncbi:unnamed protein product [Gordionus sp. m RMFG-2023]|uniref:prostatic acid phosphatase-like n=1 Tax=Gordionus sp. m RMFG-2023 TaxID=3053472 RepID=UPI0030E570C3
MTNIILRHGERPPYELVMFKNYVFNASHWPNGKTNLTNNGIVAILETGRLLKNRYDKVFNRQLSLNEIKSSSTDVRMAKSSALAFLYGFIGKKMDFNTRKMVLGLHEYDIFHIATKDDILLVSLKKCYNHAIEIINTLTIPNSTLMNYVNSNINQYNKVIEYSGWGESMSPILMVTVADPLLCDKSNNFPLPDWVTPDVYYFIQNYTDITFGLMYKENKALLKWSNGLLLSRILCNMLKHFDYQWMNIKYPQFKNYLICHDIKIVNNNIEDLKPIHMYSSHDVTIAGLLSMFEIVFDFRPKAADAFMIELWRYPNPNYISSNISSYNNLSNNNWIYSTDLYIPFIYNLKFMYKTHRNVIKNIKKDIRFEIAIQMVKDKLVSTLEDALITCTPYEQFQF